MGCCTSQNPTYILNHRRLRSEIGDDLKLPVYSSNGIPTTINDPIAILDGIILNPLAYALWCGRFNTFKTLKESMGASIEEMESLFDKQNLSGLEIIMRKGHLDLLKYFVHEYLLTFDSKIDDNEIMEKPLLQIPVANGNLDMVSFVYSYFVHVYPPPAFDVHYIDPFSGENCALVACKHFNLPMVKFLNEVCGADFTIKNAENQSALMLAAKYAENGQKASEFIIYLIEKCNVDILYKHEEVLDMVEDHKLFEYIKKSLSEYGLNVSEITKASSGKISKHTREKTVELSQVAIGAMNLISFIEPLNCTTRSFIQEEY